MYNALGKTKSGCYLSVFFIKKLGNKALIVIARDMNKRGVQELRINAQSVINGNFKNEIKVAAI